MKNIWSLTAFLCSCISWNTTNVPAQRDETISWIATKINCLSRQFPLLGYSLTFPYEVRLKTSKFVPVAPLTKSCTVTCMKMQAVTWVIIPSCISWSSPDHHQHASIGPSAPRTITMTIVLKIVLTQAERSSHYSLTTTAVMDESVGITVRAV